NKVQLALDGMKVFNFALNEVPPNVRALLEHKGKTIDDPDFFIFHQANYLINESIRKKLKISPEKYPYSIRQFGNTSSASIVLGMVTAIRESLLSKPNQIVLAGFGVGLSWGSVYMDCDPLVIPPLVEI
ncbi:MAG: 3-oxoacyl-[acyl-carrier-protein] synthase III C-terminal domain-containing protein, partial [Bacteroidota bacterium]